jgi:hypothetical protein
MGAPLTSATTPTPDTVARGEGVAAGLAAAVVAEEPDEGPAGREQAARTRAASGSRARARVVDISSG